ncbi:hypothetical protein BJ138DRAFT_228479 [Hygrophoropsis aurantiaca]|uniref:Uncharacterized protein n=1 Tax=Hygrophoropsis aurantiaca TaxID=72124 RepID=A0ACB8A8R5_9AGAM|nr:hypothetical protein BJ138DRAFT_228479 [Hygrophoropsis aurantiaca]
MSSMSNTIIANAARVVQTTRICQLSTCILIIYDHLLTFDQEIEYIWKAPWSLPTVLYVIVRYLGGGLGMLDAGVFVSQSSSQQVRSFPCLCSNESNIVYSCQTFFFLQGWPGFLIDWLMQIILQLRIYAIYDRSKMILAATGVGYVAEIISVSTILAIANENAPITNEPIPGIHICSVLNFPSSFLDIWFPIIAFEGLLCVLAIWAGIMELTARSRLQGVSSVSVVDVIVRGNLFYFFCLLSVCVVNAAMWQTLGDSWMEVPEGFTIAIKVVFGCRLILNLPKTFAPLNPSIAGYVSTDISPH